LANNVNTREDLTSLPSTAPGPKISNAKGSVIPVVCVPTTLSGGEYTKHAGATDDETHRKSRWLAPIEGPALLILDAELARLTPPSVWLSTGFRSVDHCVEALASLNGDPEADAAAKRGLSQVVEGLLRTKANPNDEEARHLSQLGVIEAMIPSSKGVQTGASHGISHQLGPFGVGHGETSCILLPAVQKYNARSNEALERQQLALDAIWGNLYIKSSLEESGLQKGSSDLATVLDVIIRSLGLPRTLKEFGIGEDKLARIARNSLANKLLKSNPIPITTEEEVLVILKDCWE
jgi:alcohol dehydrogenase class IV